MITTAVEAPPADLAALLAEKTGILLDVSLGGVPQERSVTFGELGISPLALSWPLPDGCVHTAVVTHVLEYLAPPAFFAWWDELHRVMAPKGLVYVSGPYGGDESHGWLSDPCHLTRVIDQTFLWLDPRNPVYPQHPTVGRALPRPWHALIAMRVPGPNGTIGYNATLQKQAAP